MGPFHCRVTIDSYRRFQWFDIFKILSENKKEYKIVKFLPRTKSMSSSLLFGEQQKIYYHNFIVSPFVKNEINLIIKFVVKPITLIDRS